MHISYLAVKSSWTVSAHINCGQSAAIAVGSRRAGFQCSIRTVVAGFTGLD